MIFRLNDTRYEICVARVSRRTGGERFAVSINIVGDHFNKTYFVSACAPVDEPAALKLDGEKIMRIAIAQFRELSEPERLRTSNVLDFNIIPWAGDLESELPEYRCDDQSDSGVSWAPQPG
ncbi:hypothetical protein BH11PSE11_BH11PSE11_33180 [soil metagenome]